MSKEKTDHGNLSDRLARLEKQRGIIRIAGLTFEERLAALEAAQAEAESTFKSDEIEVITGTSNPQLARDIGTILGKRPDDQAVTVFANGEPNVRISPNLRGKHVFVVQSVSPPDVNRASNELLLLLDAAKRASAEEVTAVIPDFGFGRSDRKDQSRVPIGAALYAKLYKKAGADRLLTLDLHSPQIQGFFDGPCDNLFASSVLLWQIMKDLDEDIVIAAPDTGAAKHAEKLAGIYPRALHSAVVRKSRYGVNRSRATGMIESVKDHIVLFADDMIDTFGSLNNAAQMAIDNGAREVYAMATHGYFSEVTDKGIDPLALLDDSPIQKIWITDSVNHRQGVRNHPKIQIVPAAPLLATAIKQIHRPNGSLSTLIPNNSEEFLRTGELLHI